MSYFDINKITFPAKEEKDINTWADYCELFCLLSENKFQTIDQLQDRLVEDCDTEIKKAAKRLSLSSTATGSYMANALIAEAAEEEDTRDEEEDEGVGEQAEEDENPDAIFHDKVQGEFRYLFNFLKSRIVLFGNAYPFIIQQNKIQLVDTELTNAQRLYIALMLSAILRIYSNENMNTLGHVFEQLCEPVFRKLVPANASVYPFGAGGGAEEPFFNGTFYEKVEKLGRCLHTPLAPVFEHNPHDHQHTGDGGLDWIAWHAFADNRNRMPLFFGQCACGSDWVDKEFDAHEDKWNNNLHFQDKFLLYHFITKTFRKHDGDWYKPGKINKGVILIDRSRILSMLNEDEITAVLVLYTELVDEALTVNLSDVE